MKIVDYFFAARPMLLIPVWSIYLVALNYHHQLAGKSFSLENFIMITCLTMLASGAYYINQVYDTESDRLNKKVLFLEHNLVTTRGLMLLFTILSSLPILYGMFYPKVVLFIFSQLILLSYTYSAPPIRLKDRPIGGLLANSWAFGFLIAFSIMPEMTQHNMGTLGWDNPLYFFLAVMGVHILTTISDRVGDSRTGKKTIGAMFPVRTSLLLAFIAFIGAALIALKSGFPLLLALAIVAATFTVLTLVTPQMPLILAAAKLPILLLTLLAGYFYPIYILFVVVLIFATRAYYKRRFNINYPKLA